MKNMKWIPLAFALIATACAKQAKPTPPAPVKAQANAPLTVRIRVTKSDLKFDQAAFNRSMKQIKNPKGYIWAGTANATLADNVVSIDLPLTYVAGTKTNIGPLRYFINNADASETATSTSFVVEVKPESITNNILTTPVYRVTWRHLMSGK